MDKRQILGSRGEEIAAEILKAKGYAVLQLNYRTPYGELDIVAEENGYVVFVEVKARAGTSYGSGLEAITKTKRRHLARAALVYLCRNKIRNRPCRFDVIALTLDAGGELLDYQLIPGAFEAEGGNYC